MSKIRQILRLYCQGESKRKISELTGTARNTLRKYIQLFIKGRYTIESIDEMNDHDLEVAFTVQEPPPKDQRLAELHRMLPDLEKQLKRKGVTMTSLWKLYQHECPGGYQLTQFYRYFQAYTSRFNPVMHMEHKAGDKMYIDFAGDKLWVTDRETGEVKPTEVFAAILGCSQLMYAEAVWTQKTEDLIGGCENAIFYFGGVTAAIVPDNTKSAVIRSSKYEPTLNEIFASFADHYHTVVLPARAYRPKDKSLVEGMVKIIYRTIYAQVSQRTYFSLAELNQAILAALEINNNAPFKGRDYSRRQQFEEIEKAALRPLPAYRYEFRKQAVVTVMKNGHVCLSVDKHYYSVPYRFIGKKVKILFTSTLVEVFYHYQRIAVHERQYRKYQYTTLREHLATAHQYLSDWTPEKFMEQGRSFDLEVAEYLALVMENKQHPEQAYKSCSGILSLGRKVGAKRLRNACRRARSLQVYNYPIIQQILEKGMDQMEDDPDQSDPPMPQHPNIRGREYYE